MAPSRSYESPWLNDELHIFRTSVRQFIRDRFVPRQPEWRAHQQPDATAWPSAGAMGLLLCDVPEEYGGGGGTFAHTAVVIEELGRAGVHFASFVHGSIAHYILNCGSEEQRQRWLPRMARGELVGAIALTEPGAGSDLQGIRTSARRDGDSYVINGTKTFVTNGSHAGLVCLAAKTDPAAMGPKSVSLLAVETDGLSGFERGRPMHKIGMHEQDTCELFFNDVRVPASSLLGSVEGRGISQVMGNMSYERLSIAIAAIAISEEVVSRTVKHAKERTAFGKPLLELQNTRFKLAECQTDVRVGRIFIDDCISRFIAGRLDGIEAGRAKYWLTECESRVVDQCVQLHGGMGFMSECLVARLWSDSRVHRIYGGSNEVLKESIAWSL